LDQTEGGNHTLYLSGTSSSNTEVAITNVFVIPQAIRDTTLQPPATTIIGDSAELISSTYSDTITLQSPSPTPTPNPTPIIHNYSYN
jgi:hypothetical protein